MKKQTKKFLNDLKIRTIFPFYIDNVNPIFFGSIKKFNNKSFNRKIYNKIQNLNSQELKKISEIENISSGETLQFLINRIITKISSRTGTEKNNLFIEKKIAKNNSVIYVDQKNELHDFKVIGNTNAERRYIYAIDINKNCYLFRYIEQLQFSFYLDEKNKMISGGVSWNWGNDNKLDENENIIDKVYINNLIKYFISRELKEITLSNIINALDDEEEIKNKNTKQKLKNKSKNSNESNSKNISTLKEIWSDLINKKIINNNKNIESDIIEYLNDELFYSILIITMISLAVSEELKIYFRHKTPEIYQSILKMNISVDFDKKNQTYRDDFFSILSFLKKNYFNVQKRNLKQKIENEDDAIQALIQYDEKENLYFGEPILSYEIIRNSDIPFLDEDDDIFMNSNELKILFLLTLNPDMFGMNKETYDFIKYYDLNLMVNEIDFKNNEWNDVLNYWIDQTICEWNYDYVSFLNKNLTSFIIKNNNPIDFKSKKDKYDYDANRKLFNNYLWAQIYCHAIIYKIKDMELKFNKNKYKYPHLLRGYIHDVEQLYFDWYDDFYGLPQIKKIIKKIDNFKELNKTILLLNQKINRDDKIYGKSKERQNIAFAFITASLFGVTDFLTMVYTVLTVQDTENGLKKIENIITISVGAFLSLIMICILLFTIIKPIVDKRKSKKGE